MGGLCSKQNPKLNPYAGRTSTNQDKKQYYQVQREAIASTKSVTTTPPVVPEKMDKKQIEVKESPKFPSRYSNASDDEFYDGIPRYRRSSFRKSRSSRATKVSEVSSILSRAGSVGLERAVDVLDTLGSSVTNLNVKSGFVSRATTKNNELSILAFEVANTIVKGSNLMESLSRRSIRRLKDVVFQTEGIQQLISKDTDELLSIVVDDKREELKVFSCEVVRFGNRCKDPQWHNLDRFFEKRSRDRTSQKQLRETADSVMPQLMALVQLTAELYQELNVMARLDEEYQQKRLEVLVYNPGLRGDRDNSLNILAAEMKSQKKLVKTLKKKSLWSASMEEIMGNLVDIVLFLNQEINTVSGSPGPSESPKKDSTDSQPKLGPAGLDLHYANIIILIDSIVARSSAIPPNSRETLYQSLPPNVKASLRSKLQSFHIEKELTITEIKDEMEKTLHWLVAIATNTAKAHHGFGWVGEWANATGSELNQRSVGPIDVMRIETLHHADREKTEAYILELLLWLNYLVSRSNVRANVTSCTVKPHVVGPHDKALTDSTQSNTDNADCEPLENRKHEKLARVLSHAHDSGLEEEHIHETRTKDDSTTADKSERDNADCEPLNNGKRENLARVPSHTHDSGLEEENIHETRMKDDSTPEDKTRTSGSASVDLGRGDATSLDAIDRVESCI